MLVIFRICGNESQPGLQLVKKAGYPPVLNLLGVQWNLDIIKGQKTGKMFLAITGFHYKEGFLYNILLLLG